MAYTTINKHTDYFNTKLYTGNGSTNAITGVGFQPDMVWCKARSYNDDHTITDVVRGNTKALYPNNTNAEATSSNRLTAFGTDGFTLSNSGDVNSNSSTYTSWNWKAGNSQGSSNTDGSINTTYTSVNTTAGFSISTYTGTGSNATVGHGLGVAPSLVLVKVLSTGNVWCMYNKALGPTHYLQFDTSSAVDNAAYWNDTAPTNNVFSIGTASGVNTSGATYVAYCFAEKTGYCKVGKYSGNANANGNFIYTGFKPSFIILKGANSENWSMYDNKRLGYNADNNTLHTNTNDAEATSDDIDILSNGFKIRRATGLLNDSGVEYYWTAFGQSLVGSNNVPCTAR